MWLEERSRSRLRGGINDALVRDSVMIRNFRPGDLEETLEIDREVFGGYDPAIFTAFYESYSGSTLVAEVGGAVAGFLLGFKHMPFEGRIFWLAVKPGYQSRGIGMRLMLEALLIFRQMGALSVTLEVRVSNRAAQSLYSNLGFLMTGIFPGYYSDGEAAVIMKRRI
jgi:ribosomal-protein-alanine N-acetyltransferase